MGVDELVHERLRVRRLVGLVVAPPPVAEEVDDDILREALPEGEGEPAGPDDGLGVVAVHVEDGRLHRLGHVGGVDARPRLENRRREPDLVVDDDVDRPPRPVGGELGEVERLRHDALAGEGGVAVEEEGEDAPFPVTAPPVLLGAGDPLEDGVDRLEVARVGDDLDEEGAVGRRVDADRPEVVLDVPRAARHLGIDVALELPEDAGEVLADDRGEDVEPSPVAHPHDRLLDAVGGGGVEDGVEEGDEALGALEPEPLVTGVLRVEEGLERLRPVEAVEDPDAFGVARHRDGHLRPLLDPGLLLRLLDVHVFDARRPAVRVPERGEDPAEGEGRLTPDPARRELPVEVPHGEPVVVELELGVHDRPTLAEGVEVGDEVAPHPVGVDEPEDLRLLLGPTRGPDRRVVVDGPAGRDVGNVERREDLVVEAVGAEEEVVDPPEELPRLGALDDPVVVRGGEGDDPTDAVAGEEAGIGALEAGRGADGPDPDDETLVGHEAGDRLHRPDGPGIREARRRPGEVVGGEAVPPGATHEVLVALPEAEEVPRLRFLDAGDEEDTAPVGPLVVDGEPEVDVGVGDDVGDPVDEAVRDVEGGQPGEGPHDGPPDEVGEAHLSGSSRPAELVVDDRPVHLEELRGDLPEGRRRRHGQALVHPAGDRPGDPP